MMPVGGEIATDPSVLESTVDAVEALCFARDLGGTLTHVLVAATGRALGTSDAVGARLVSRQGARGVGVVTVGAGEVAVNVVESAERAPLPQVRAEVDAILHAVREGRCVGDARRRPAIAVLEHGYGADVTRASLSGVPLVLGVGSLRGDPIQLELCLRVEAGTLDAESAEALLSEVTHLLRRPYRRLV